MRKLCLLLLAFVVSVLLASSSDAVAGQYTIRATQTFASTHPWHKGFEKFKEIIEAKTDGKIRVQNYPAGQLSGGNNRTMNEQVQAGTLQLLVQSPPSWAGLAPKSQIFNLPFMFPSNAVGLKVATESEVSKKILAQAYEGLGVTVMDIWENGFRNLTCRNKIIHSPDDLKGMKVRVPATPLLTDVFQQLGALPVTISMPEVYTSLQQGAVDAQENPVSAIFSNKLHEVAPKITMWRYCWDPGIVTINTKFYEGLPKDLQAAVADALKEAGKYVNELTAREDRELIADIEKSGAEVYYMTDAESEVFRQAMAPVYAKYEPQFGADLIEELRQTVAATEKALKESK